MKNLKLNFKEFTFNNGFKIILIKKEVKFFNLSFGIKVGSAYEDENQKGYSHFIEHMLFKSNLNFDNNEVNKRIEFLGGNYDAFTDYGSTVISLNGLSCDIENAIELISSMVRYPLFKEDEIEVEREVILSEIDSCNSNYEEYSFIRLNEVAFKKSHLKFDIAGSKQIVKNAKKVDLYNFYSNYYVPNNSHVVIISSYDDEYIISLLKRYFESWKKKIITYPKLLVEDNQQGIVTTYKKDLEQSTVCYLFTFNELLQSEKLALKLIEYKLGGGSNSILFQDVREKNGLAYDIYTQLELSDEFKCMYIFCAVNDKNVEKVRNIIDKSIESIKEDINYFDEYNLKLMKKLQLISIYETLENNEGLSIYVLDRMISNKDVHSYLDDFKKVEEINSQELLGICRKYLKNPTIHILRRH